MRERDASPDEEILAGCNPARLWLCSAREGEAMADYAIVNLLGVISDTPWPDAPES
jgi:hypothetical protein